MADIVNLRRFRKKKARAEKEAEADENRVRHGRSKAERSADDTLSDKAKRDWAGHRIDAPRSADGTDKEVDGS